jgi:hypothetical protein
VRKFDIGFVAESFESVDVRALVLRLDKQELLKKRSNLEFAATNVNAQSECGKLLSIIKRAIQLSTDGN